VSVERHGETRDECDQGWGIEDREKTMGQSLYKRYMMSTGNGIQSSVTVVSDACYRVIDNKVFWFGFFFFCVFFFCVVL
jgi:hypothetical protein